MGQTYRDHSGNASSPRQSPGRLCYSHSVYTKHTHTHTHARPQKHTHMPIHINIQRDEYRTIVENTFKL